MSEKLVEINGKITAIDLVKKNVTIRGEDNAPHGFSWDTEPLDIYFKKQMVGYYQSFKYDPDTYLLKGAHYWQEGKEVMAKLPQPEGKFPPRKPRVTIGFTIAVAQYENLRVECEGKDTAECKALLGEALDALGKNHEPTRDLIQGFKRRLL
jgi:hypothetical protein